MSIIPILTTGTAAAISAPAVLKLCTTGAVAATKALATESATAIAGTGGNFAYGRIHLITGKLFHRIQ